MIKIKLKKNVKLIGGHLLKDVAKDKIYEGAPFKIGHAVNHSIIDDSEKKIIISNTCLREYFNIKERRNGRIKTQTKRNSRIR